MRRSTFLLTADLIPRCSLSWANLEGSNLHPHDFFVGGDHAVAHRDHRLDRNLGFETAVTTSTMFALPTAIACVWASDLRPASATALIASLSSEPVRAPTPSAASKCSRWVGVARAE